MYELLVYIFVHEMQARYLIRAKVRITNNLYVIFVLGFHSMASQVFISRRSLSNRFIATVAMLCGSCMPVHVILNAFIIHTYHDLIDLLIIHDAMT